MDFFKNLIKNFKGLGRRKLVYVALSVVAVLFFATVPAWLNVDESYFGYYFFIVCIYVVCAQAWNLIAGYAGQISLAGNAFFGLGAFTMAMLWWYDVTKTMYYFDPLLMFLAVVLPIVDTHKSRIGKATFCGGTSLRSFNPSTRTIVRFPERKGECEMSSS